MAFRADNPWMLLLLIPALLCVYLLHRKYRLRTVSIKRNVSLALRLIVTALVVLALASPTIISAADAPSRWIIMDVSDSARGVMGDMENRIADEIENSDGKERLGVIVFGNGAMVETPLSDEPVFGGVHAAVGGEASDLDSALRLASVLLPGGTGGITVLSDELAYAQQSTIDLLNAGGIKVDTLTYLNEHGADAQITELESPVQAYEGQSLTLQAIIDSNSAMDGTLALYQNGNLTAAREVKLQKGENRFAFTDTAEQTGQMRYEVRFVANGDTQVKNNFASCFVSVQGKPNVLLVSNGSNVEKLLESSGLSITAVRPSDMPDSGADYLPYDSVVLDNVGYDEASETKWEALKNAVQTLGRGLCVLGGDNSYALGGYRGTAIEEMLPVNIDVRNKQRIPALSLVIAIDKSGSMSTGMFGTPIIEVAKEAAIQAIGVLNEKDKVGVIGFDDTAKWAVPFGFVTDLAEVERLIGTIRADGGTAFYSPMTEAYRALTTSETPQKHVIFLSDGQPADTGFQDIALAMNKAGITLTTVAIGSGADAQLMKLLSTLGGGRSYAAGEFDDLPKIFTKETMLKSGSYVQNRQFTPIITEQSALTDYEGLPMLQGYLTTVEKPIANVALVSDEEDPLLAWWRFGAGTVVAWTSDARGSWSSSYLGWDEAPRFFGGMVSKTLPSSSNGGTSSASITGDSMRITYETDSKVYEGTVEATIINSEGEESRAVLAQTGEGIYECEVHATIQGAYGVRVEHKLDGQVIGSAESGAVKGFPEEYDLRAQGKNGLRKLSEKTGGRELTEEDGLRLSQLTAAQTSKSLRQVLCIAALVIWLVGVALEKLPWEQALEKWVGSVKSISQAASEKREIKRCNAENQASREKPRNKSKKRFEEAANTADALLSAAKKRRG